MATTDPKQLASGPISVTDAMFDGVKRGVLQVQEYTLLSARAVVYMFSSPHYVSDVLEQMDIIGVGS
ncbi:MAG: hypothetical protein ACRD4Y_06920, partial [Candidatus Acidiferrales bacterium]